MPKTRKKKQVAETWRDVATDGSLSRDVATGGVISRRVRNSRRKLPIHLPNLRSGQRQTALSLDAALAEDSDATLLAVVGEPEADLMPDLRDALKAAKLTKMERKALEQVQKGTPVYRVHKALGTTPKAAKRATQSAIAKVSKVAARHLSFCPIPGSLRLVFREHLPAAPGHRPPMFSPVVLDPVFLEIMAYEKYYALLSERDPGNCTKNRLSRVRVRRRFILFATEIMEQEVRLELLHPQLVGLRNWQSAEAIEAMARDRIRARRREEAEAAERARINALTDTELDQEAKASETRRPVLRESLRHSEKHLAKLRKQREQRQSGNGVREIINVITSGLVEAEQEVERIGRELATEGWKVNELREQQAYRARQTLLPDVLAVLNSKEAKAARNSNIEHLKRAHALIACHAYNPAVVGDLVGLDRVLQNAIALESWIDRIDQAGKLSAGGI